MHWVRLVRAWLRVRHIGLLPLRHVVHQRLELVLLLRHVATASRARSASCATAGLAYLGRLVLLNDDTLGHVRRGSVRVRFSQLLVRTRPRWQFGLLPLLGIVCQHLELVLLP